MGPRVGGNLSDKPLSVCIIFSTLNWRETLGILDNFLFRKILPQATNDGNVEIWDQWARNKNRFLFSPCWDMRPPDILIDMEFWDNKDGKKGVFWHRFVWLELQQTEVLLKVTGTGTHKSMCILQYNHIWGVSYSLYNAISSPFIVCLSFLPADFVSVRLIQSTVYFSSVPLINTR